MSKFKDIEQLSEEDIESFFDSDNEVTYDFVAAASRSKMPKMFISRHTYVGAVSATRLVMWAKRRSTAKTLAEISCSIDLDELSIDDTWSKRKKKGCELFFPDGQRVIVESMDEDNIFIDTLVANIAAVHGSTSSSYDNEGTSKVGSVFSEPGVARTDTALMDSRVIQAAEPDTTEKTPVVTRDVIIESLKRASDGSISPKAIKQWAKKVRDCKIIDADEAMVGYILFSLSRIDEQNDEMAMESINEFYERLTVTLV
ncbi:MAG TPA: hypothetical protein PLT55_03490 [Acidimicrobiia bacterium]|nr:hypothetical protein [Acidimicrobiia bacterium]